jgi:hypothetical protein
MCNVDVKIEQPQYASVYKEFALISEQPLTRMDIVKNHFSLFFALFQTLSMLRFS